MCSPPPSPTSLLPPSLFSPSSSPPSPPRHPSPSSSPSFSSNPIFSSSSSSNPTYEDFDHATVSLHTDFRDPILPIHGGLLHLYPFLGSDPPSPFSPFSLSLSPPRHLSHSFFPLLHQSYTSFLHPPPNPIFLLLFFPLLLKSHPSPLSPPPLIPPFSSSSSPSCSSNPTLLFFFLLQSHQSSPLLSPPPILPMAFNAAIPLHTNLHDPTNTLNDGSLILRSFLTNDPPSTSSPSSSPISPPHCPSSSSFPLL